MVTPEEISAQQAAARQPAKSVSDDVEDEAPTEDDEEVVDGEEGSDIDEDAEED